MPLTAKFWYKVIHPYKENGLRQTSTCHVESDGSKAEKFNYHRQEVDYELFNNYTISNISYVCQEAPMIPLLRGRS